MAIEGLELVFRFIFLIGLGLAGLGACWLYKYVPRPKPKDYEKWKKKHKSKHDGAGLHELESGFVDPGMVYDADGYPSHKDFGKGWRRKKKVGIVFVIIGPIFAASQGIVSVLVF